METCNTATGESETPSGRWVSSGFPTRVRSYSCRHDTALDGGGNDDTSPTLFDVQEPGDGEETTPEERGEAVIEELVDRAGIKYTSDDTDAVIAVDTETAVLDAVESDDTVCVGATRPGTVSEAVSGSLPERIGEEVDRTVVMARGPEESPMSVREAVTWRLEV